MRSLLLPLKEKLEKEIEKIDSQTHAKGGDFSVVVSYKHKENSHTQLQNHPHIQPPMHF
jgi:hypothetical protein